MRTLLSETKCNRPMSAKRSQVLLRQLGSLPLPKWKSPSNWFDERLEKGAASGYEFVIAEDDSSMVGYACFGEIPCTVGSYDLYWIVVDPPTNDRASASN